MNNKHPCLTVDGLICEDNAIVLIKRKHEPYKDIWALPGGFVEYGETTENAVKREIKEETGLSCDVLGLFGVFSDPNRDPRGHTISIIYELKRVKGTLHGGDDAKDAQFFQLTNLPKLAFDHQYIIQQKMEKMKL